MAAYRANPPGAGEPCHPTWIHFVNELRTVDGTGHGIVSLSARPDARALQTMRALLQTSSQWCRTRDVLFAGGLLLQCYWQAPMQQMTLAILKISPENATKSFLRSAWRDIEAAFGNMKVVDGAFVSNASRGQHPLKNPSERRSGRERFFALINELSNWRKVCDALALLFDAPGKLNLCEVLGALGSVAGFTVFSDQPRYKNVRLARTLAHMCSKKFKDTPREWFVWRSMSRHVIDAVENAGLWDPSEADRFKFALAQKVNQKNYGYTDMICFLCLIGGLVEDD